MRLNGKLTKNCCLRKVLFAKPTAGIFLFFLFLGVDTSLGAVLTEDTSWQGEVNLAEDLIIPQGVTLTIAAGTVIRIDASESTKIDPESFSPLTEIVVRGHLEAEGDLEHPILFSTEKKDSVDERWAGIIIDGGNAWLRDAVIEKAETAVHILQGWTKLKKAVIRNNTYGIVAQGAKSGVKYEDTDITGNDYGVMLYGTPQVIDQGSRLAGNRKNDFHQGVLSVKGGTAPHEARQAEDIITRIYGDETLLGTTVWKGKIIVNGVVRVEMSGSLLIAPGTTVEFGRRDTNNDTIGENGLYIQGLLYAKGTPEKPIVFKSGEEKPRKGDWDAINIMGSDRSRSLIEHCRIQDAYRGLHFHFTNIAVSFTVLHHNYRGVQFQESLVEMNNCRFIDNNSAIQARDSEVRFVRNKIVGNYTGANFFRITMEASSNQFIENRRDGIRVREGAVVLTENDISGNRFGLLLSDAVYGTFNHNTITLNSETGLSLRNNDNIEIKGNLIAENGISGMRIQDSRGTISGNHIAKNAERGIGIISFSGTLSGNNIVENGCYGLEVEGDSPVSAPGNWWGVKEVGKVVFDKDDDPRLGKVAYEPFLDKALPLGNIVNSNRE